MRFLWVFIGTFVLLVALYLIAYRVVDPDSEYGTGKFPAPLANARMTKLATFKSYAAKHKVEGLFLGSSRSMAMEPSLAEKLTGLTFFNFSVQNAMVEDYLAIYNWVIAQGQDPKLLVVGVDVEAFDPQNKFDARLTHNQALMGALDNGQHESGLPSLLSKFSRAGDELNVENALAMAKGIELKLRPARQTDVVEPDGHTEYPYDDEAVRNGTFNLQKMIGQTIPTYAANYKDMDRLSPARETLLRTLVREAAKREAKVILWVPPLHPETVQALGKSTPYVQRLRDTVAFVESLQAEFPQTVTAVDLSSPDKFGGNEIDWRDGAHMKKPNAERALAVILAHQLVSPAPSAGSWPPQTNPKPAPMQPSTSERAS